MSNEEYKNIHEFDFNLICGIFFEYRTSGSRKLRSTLKALSFIDNLNKESVIVDLGCGTGGQTMVLAQRCSGTITGLDLFADFIEIFNRNASTLELENKVKGIVGSMDNLPFENESLDLIWSGKEQSIMLVLSECNRMAQIPEKRRIHCCNRSIVVYRRTTCRN